MADLRTPTRPSHSPPPYRRTKGPLIALVILGVIGSAAVAVIVANALDEPERVELGTEPSEPATPAASSTTVDPQAATKAEIIAIYRKAWEAYVAVASDPNGQPEDPRLGEHTVGNALLASQLSIRKWRAEGHVLDVERLELHPEVVELGRDTAVIEDCSIDVSGLVDAETGEVVTSSGPPEATLSTATFRLVDGVWMQNGFTDRKQTCVPPES